MSDLEDGCVVATALSILVQPPFQPLGCLAGRPEVGVLAAGVQYPTDDEHPLLGAFQKRLQGVPAERGVDRHRVDRF